ncbi:Hypothetical_protein [Hexamita inflata]|uniref:Hypothetical_protein n=1 Tax=Hexamita inflata TaxID=28002 RepID=A0AA86Q1I9_9EUKA|nr:Hypothetical protein HINF_LOCUS32590 [Hexamita inflata]
MRFRAPLQSYFDQLIDLLIVKWINISIIQNVEQNGSIQYKQWSRMSKIWNVEFDFSFLKTNLYQSVLVFINLTHKKCLHNKQSNTYEYYNFNHAVNIQQNHQPMKEKQIVYQVKTNLHKGATSSIYNKISHIIHLNLELLFVYGLVIE